MIISETKQAIATLAEIGETTERPYQGFPVTPAGVKNYLLGLDWTTDIAAARRRVGDKVALQGNLDPCTLYASPDVIRASVGRILEGFGPGSGHVFNLGHGIHPDIDPAHPAAMVEAVHELSRPYHAEG